MVLSLTHSDGEVITPDKLVGHDSNIHSRETVAYNRRVQRAREKVFEALCEIRTPFEQLDPLRQIKGDGPRFTEPLLHYGIALSMQDIWNCAQSFGVRPEPMREEDLPEFIRKQPLPAEKFEDWVSSKKAVQDAVLFHLRTIVLPSLRLVKCFNTEERIWVYSLYSNLEYRNKTSEDPDKAKKLADVLGRDSADLKWYWDYKLCGIEYSAPWDDYNIWPAEENQRWRRTWFLEEAEDSAGGGIAYWALYDLDLDKPLDSEPTSEVSAPADELEAAVNSR